MKNFKFQERDLRIIKFVYEQRVVTFDQLRRAFFFGRSKAVVSRRLSELCARNLLGKGSYVHKGKTCTYYVPTDIGFGTVKENWKFKLDLPNLKSDSIRHDLRAVDIRLKLSKYSQITGYFSENVLQSSGELGTSNEFGPLIRLHSDAGIVLRDPQGRLFVYALELEISPKSLERYIRKLQAYYLCSELEGVIYICGDQSIITIVHEADRIARSDRESILHTCLESCALVESDQIIFTNPEGHNLVIQ